MQAPSHTRIPARRRGFTLIEIMAVILILSILTVVLVTQLGGSRDAVAVGLTRAWIGQLEAALAEYEGELGEYPRSSFDEAWGAPPNAFNLGGEALVAHLWSQEWRGGGLPEDELCNSDGDATRRPLTVFASRELFELRDSWDNPIAYLSRVDYGRSDVYLTFDPSTGEPIESSMSAAKDARTGLFANARGFQLRSAGPDGQFGTADDITNFEER